jgi:hypothetical protein
MAEIEKTKQDIRSKILKIANKEIAEDDVNVLGKPYYLEPRSLVYLFMEVQQDYNIDIPEEQLINQQFATINGISSIILSCLDKEV